MGTAVQGEGRIDVEDCGRDRSFDRSAAIDVYLPPPCAPAASSASQDYARMRAELAMISSENALLARRVLKLKRELAEVRKLALHDALTGLPNRRLLADRATLALAAARRNSQRIAVLMVDIDDFKTINDCYGHGVGDAVLREVAGRLADAVRASDTSARIGGDEFAVLLADVGAHGGAATAAAKIAGVLSSPYCVAGRELAVSASIGLAVYPDDGADFERLSMTADRQMYHHKSGGRAVPPADDTAAGHRVGPIDAYPSAEVPFLPM